MANCFANAWLRVVVFAFVALFTDSLMQGDAVKSERELRQHIFSNYDKQARPVRRASTPVPVDVSIAPISVLSMNEKDQIFVLNAWLMMRWTDEYLQWDPSEYDNITQIRVSPYEIWKPDMALYTATSDTSVFPVKQPQAIAFSDGLILWVPPFTMKSRCPLPFLNNVTARSSVECNIRIGSWTSQGSLMDIQLYIDKDDMENFLDINPEWKLVKFVKSRESKQYPCCEEEYPVVNYNFILKRRNSQLD